MLRIGVFWTPTNQGSALGLKDMQTAAAKEGSAVVPVSARTRDEAELAFSALKHKPPDVLVVHAAYLGSPELVQIREFAVRSRMPTISAFSSLTRDGLLMSYGPDLASYYRRAAYYVDKILKGAKPADLPMSSPPSSS